MDSIEDIVVVFKKWISQNARAGDVALVQGDFGLTYAMVNFCKEKGLIPVYATTERKVEEEKKDGVVLVKRTFNHVRFRVY